MKNPSKSEKLGCFDPAIGTFQKKNRSGPHTLAAPSDYLVMKTMHSFDDIVETHGPTVLRICASLLGPGPDAEDAWSETFLAALRAYPFDGTVNLEAWLVRVARNKSIDVLRSGRRENPVPDDELLDATDTTTQFEFFDDELWAAVAELSARQRFVVAHRFIAQWSYPEIAEKLGCTPAAARRTGADAVAALRRGQLAGEDH